MPYPSFFLRSWLMAVVMLAGLAASPTSWSQQSENSEPAIQYLLGYVADSGLTFIRNSESHDAADAAEHMNNKYQHYRDKIETPEDFIRLCASKSLITGKPYLVIRNDGTEIRTDDWLTHALASYRNGQVANSD